MFKTFYGFHSLQMTLPIVEQVMPPERYEYEKFIVHGMEDNRVVVTVFYKERIH